LIDHAWKHLSQKRGGGKVISLDAIPSFALERAPELVALDDALHRLAEIVSSYRHRVAIKLVRQGMESASHLQRFEIERQVGKSLPRRMLDGFDYGQRTEKLEIPVAERLAAHRERQAAGRAKKKTSEPGGNGRKRNGRGRGNKGQGQGQPAAQGGGGGRSRRSRGRRVFS